MQRNDSALRKMPIVEEVGFKLEHQQEDDPRSRIDAGRKSLDYVTGIDGIAKTMRRRCPFLGEKNENVDGQQAVYRILE
jgi:hypothetical protein